MADKKKKQSISIDNRRARFEYEFLEKLEAGIVLSGTEIKSIRQGHVNLRDAYCFFKKGELFVKSMFIGIVTLLMGFVMGLASLIGLIVTIALHVNHKRKRRADASAA